MSPHGGKREGAGRKTAEEKTVNLCGVRTTPTRLRLYKLAAGRDDMTLTAWVEKHLDAAAGIDRVANMVGILEFLDDYEPPKAKRKGKK